jgi:hypothetical protein
MIVPLSLGLRRRKTSDGLLSSENLKEERVVTTSLTVYHANSSGEPSGKGRDGLNAHLVALSLVRAEIVGKAKPASQAVTESRRLD